MPSQASLDNFNRLRNSPGATVQTIDRFPPYPEDIKKWFPSLVQHELDVEKWRQNLNIALRGGPQAG